MLVINETYEGKIHKTLRSLSEATGIKYNTLSTRYRQGLRGEELTGKVDRRRLSKRRYETTKGKLTAKEITNMTDMSLRTVQRHLAEGRDPTNYKRYQRINETFNRATKC